MSNIRIIYPNLIDAATLSASPGLVSTLPVENLADPLRERMARATVDENQHILGDFAAGATVSGMALVRHNLTTAATWRLKLYDGAGQTGSLLYDSGAVDIGVAIAWGEFPWGLVPWGGEGFANWPVAYSVMWFDPVFAVSFDLEIDDASNPDTYVEASRLYMGAAWTPADTLNNFSYGLTLTWVDPSTQERTDGGSLRTDEEDSYRRIDLSLDWLSEADRAVLSAIARRAGKRGDLFLSCYPEEGGEQERDHAGLFKFVDNVGLTHNYVNNFAARSVVFEET